MYIIFLDFKYKEMEYWKILMAVFLNMTVVYIPTAIWGNPGIAWQPLAIIPVFLLLSYLNGKINKEKIVGKADVDVFALQALISTGVVLVVNYQSSGDPMMSFLGAAIVIQAIFTSIFIGLALTVIIWVFVIIVDKIRTKDKISVVLKSRREVPTLIAFLPWTYLNMYMIMGL